MEYYVIIGNIAWFFLIWVPLLAYNVDNVKFKEESLLMVMRNVLINISVSHPVKQATLNGFKFYIAGQYFNVNEWLINQGDLIIFLTTLLLKFSLTGGHLSFS